MRPILASLALLLVLALGGLLLLPRLIDDEAARALLNRIAIARTGHPLEVEGAIEFSLLPRPTLSFARARLGGGKTDSAPMAARFDRVDVELAIGALLRGRFEVARMRLVRPSLEVRSGPEQALLALLDGRPKRSAGLVLHSVEVLDGSLAFMRSQRGRPVSITGINALLTAMPGGGFTLEGRGRTLKAPLTFRLEGGALQPSRPLRLLLRAQLGVGGRFAKMRYAGTLAARDGELRAGGTLELVAAEPEGLVDAISAMLDRLPPELPAMPRPIRLLGKLESRAGDLLLRELELGLGDQQLVGELHYRPGAKPTLEARFEANRLELPLSFAALAAWRDSLPAPPYEVGGRLDLRIGALQLGGKPVRQLRLKLRVDTDGALVVDELAGRFPGGADLRLGGTLAAVAGELRWLGEIALTGQSLRETLDWLGVSLPGGAEEGALAAYAVHGKLRLSGNGVSLRDGELRLDATSARGSFALRFGERPQLAVAATLDRLGIDAYLGLLPDDWRPADLRRWLQSFDTALDLTLERITLAGLRARSLRLRAGLEKGRLTIGAFELADLAGASAGVAGTVALDRLDYDLVADVEVPSPARLARLAGLPRYELLAGLGAVRGQATLRGTGEAGEAEVELHSEAAQITVRAEGEKLASLDSFNARIRLESPSFAGFARSFGVPPLRPQRVRGPLSLAVELERLAAGPLAIRASGKITEVGVDFEGRWMLEPSALKGRLLLSPAPAADLLDTVYRLAAPFLGLLPEPPPSWPGQWPDARLDWSWLERTRLRLDLGFDVPANGLRLTIGDGRLAIEDLDMALAGGRWTGSFELVRRGCGVVARAALMLDGARIERLLSLLGIADGLSGELELDADLRSGGNSIADLVGHLSGGVSLRLRNGEIAGIGRDEAGALLVGVVDRLPFRLLGGELRVARGIAESGDRPLTLAQERLRGEVELMADLRAWITRTVLRLRDPDGRTATVELFGPLGAPKLRLASTASGNLSPEALASPPDAPAPRIPPRSAGPERVPPP